MFASALEAAVPEAKDQNEDSFVNWGTVELKKFTIQIQQLK